MERQQTQEKLEMEKMVLSDVLIIMTLLKRVLKVLKGIYIMQGAIQSDDKMLKYVCTVKGHC